MSHFLGRACQYGMTIDIGTREMLLQPQERSPLRYRSIPLFDVFLFVAFNNTTQHAGLPDSSA